MSSWGTLDAERVSGWINFDGASDWRYRPDDRDSMAAKQAEGVAYLWNLLSERRLALLADEVGMGKTFQAIGVAALLWKVNPDARILVMAPNRDICYHWRRELNTFVHHLYREVDHNVKNGVDGGLVPSVQVRFKLGQLATAVERGAGHLYLTTIHSLSGLVPSDKKGKGNLAGQASKAAASLNNRIKTALGGKGFDLVIVDEAHYLRNRGGGSQRVAAAQAFFGKEGNRLAQRSLLMTATPSHTRLKDIVNILSYFGDVGAEKEPLNPAMAQELLERYGLRRLRLMEGNQRFYSKRHYRNEQALPTDFDGRPNAELFFALYQKQLVTELNKNSNNRSLMYGYLEGFESIGRAQNIPSDDTKEEDSHSDETQSGDFHGAMDSHLLEKLTGQYYELLNTFPDHPKYGTLVERCVPTSEEALHKPPEDLKQLIFVRRIPSVREITQRVNAAYDEVLGQMILSAWNKGAPDSHPALQWRDSGWSRKGFAKWVATNPDDEEDQVPLGSDAGKDAADPDYLGSRIAELFSVDRNSKGQIDCVNVRLRFTRRESIYALFLEPSLDYLEAAYLHYGYSQKESRADYTAYALRQRLQGWAKDYDWSAAVGAEDELEKQSFYRAVPTVWQYLVRRLPEYLQKKLAGWAKDNPAVAENFGNYFKAGALYASPVMVELYCWFVSFRPKITKNQAQKSYLDFLTYVEPKIEGSLLLRYFQAALESFDSLCGKIIDHPLDAWERGWTGLTHLSSPGAHASGESAPSRRQNLILGFNSPFYPNVLVATSVFQEGVNLHMNCHQVYHYGLAGSPGDNEQRVGRVDRLFGCVNRRLQADDDNASLGIYYPYLARSVDEDQVGSFIERKHSMESRMDACLQPKSDGQVTLGTNDWSSFLRRPASLEDEPILDPYPARLEGVEAQGYIPHQNHEEDELVDRLRHHIERAIDPALESVREEGSVHEGLRTLFLIDPKVQTSSAIRHQPIFVNKVFSPEISALISGTAYRLSFISPIANKEKFDRYCRQSDNALNSLEALADDLAKRFPMVQLRLNDQAENSHFYLSTVINLPVFLRAGELKGLSASDVAMAINDLKHYSDALEIALFDSIQDIAAKDIDSAVNFVPKAKFNRRVAKGKDPDLFWRQAEGIHGTVSYLTHSFDQVSFKQAVEILLPEVSSRDPVTQTLQLNQRYPYVRFSRKTNQLRLTLPMPGSAISREAGGLRWAYMERWFSYICGE